MELKTIKVRKNDFFLLSSRKKGICFVPVKVFVCFVGEFLFFLIDVDCGCLYQKSLAL